jgi:uncharacterized repeat protein (TIGR02543 family)
MKKILVVAVILVLALQLMPIAASAEEPSAPTQLWVAPSETNGLPVRIDLFQARTGGSDSSPVYTYQLYLPGDADAENCFLSWDGSLQATVDDVTYSSGSCPVPPVDTPKAYTFMDGDQTTTLNLVTYQGAPGVQRIFIEIDESYVEEGETQPHTIAGMDGDPDHEKYCVGEIYINGMNYALTRMNGRGNATWQQAEDKRPYNITLGKKINFPGIDSEKTGKWSLLAENLDHSLLGNRAGYWLAHELGVGQDTTSADLWMNGEYQGCYTVTPKTDSFVPDDGFLIEQDNYLEKSVSEGGDPQFELDGLVSHVVYPSWASSYNLITVKEMGDDLLRSGGVVDESPENMEAAAGRIRTWLQEAWDAMRSDTGYNAQGRYYTDYIDIESFAKMYLMQEYVKSYDVCAGSIYFHRDGQGENDKLIAGPLWDLDNAMGSTYENIHLGDASDRRSAQGDFIQSIGNYQDCGSEYKTSIYKTLSRHEDFMEEVVYQYNRNRALFDSLPDDFASMSEAIEASARMNHCKVNDLGHDTGKDNHYYSTQTTLGSDPYQQTYLPITDSKTDWDRYVQNMGTYITVRSLWFSDNYSDPDYIDPADCTHAYQEVGSQPATCTSSGYITYKCSICRDVETEILAQLPHDYQDGKCAVCQDPLLSVRFACAGGASITVYETQDMSGPCAENAALTHPRSPDTGLIDGSGNGQVNFVVNLQPGYAIAGVAAGPETSYKNLKVPADTGIENGYRVTKVSGDLTVTVTISGSVGFDPNGGAGTMEDQSIILGSDQVLQENVLTRKGYAFAGWNTAADGSGTAYADKSTVNLSGNTVLYAQWLELTEITEAKNAGDAVLVSVHCRAGENAGLFAARYDNAGRFLGAETMQLEPGDSELTVPREGAYSLRFFLLDENGAPLCASVEALQ